MSPIRQDFLRIWAMEKKEKRIIGITGGVGTGKSTVMELLKEDYGAEIILADLVAHELMEPGTEGLRRFFKGRRKRRPSGAGGASVP